MLNYVRIRINSYININMKTEVNNY